MTKKRKVNITIWVTLESKEMVKRDSEKTGLSMSATIQQMINDKYFKKVK